MSNTSECLRNAKSVARRALSWVTSPRSALIFGEPFFWLLGLRRKGDRIHIAHVKRVFVVRLDEIGDVVLTTSFLRELRRNLPEAWITLVVKPAVYNLIELFPYVNQVLNYDWQVKGRFGNLRRHWRAFKLARRSLWRRRFDLAILPRWDADHYHGTYLQYFSGARWRVGYSENINPQKKSVNSSFDILLTHAIRDSSPKHEVEHNLDVIRFLGGRIQDDRLELYISKEDEAFAHQLLKNHRVKPDDLVIGLAPGAGAPKRLWPIDRFAELGLWLQNAYGARMILVGGPGEEALAKELERALGNSVINNIGSATLRQTTAILKRCRLFVGNDAGPMHIAAAVGVPVVELSCHPQSGSLLSANSPERFQPWGIIHRVIQPGAARPPCTTECIADHPHCILGITVDHVKEVIAIKLNWRTEPI